MKSASVLGARESTEIWKQGRFSLYMLNSLFFFFLLGYYYVFLFFYKFINTNCWLEYELIGERKDTEKMLLFDL